MFGANGSGKTTIVEL
ncbi:MULTISPECIES: ATP-binding protein [Acinetobacter calcoaceticus/baumannii complex]|nr:ATP-binding protein [Acinetobacter sp. 1592897]